jgi:hypothetical protein
LIPNYFFFLLKMSLETPIIGKRVNRIMNAARGLIKLMPIASNAFTIATLQPRRLL